MNACKGRLWPCALVLLSGATALADWNVGDPHKMHFPQLPDPNGWDVNMGVQPLALADDWMCSQSGWVNDIHFWFSYRGDLVAPLHGIQVTIFSDDRTGPFSKPGDPLWSRQFLPHEFTTREWDVGNQGWYDPWDQFFLPGDHTLTWQANIDHILDPFWQEEGTIYWLGLSVITDPFAQVGWKTSLDHFEDDAVWFDPTMGWHELFDPFTGVSMDLAFVITPSPGALALLTIAGVMTTRRRR